MSEATDLAKAIANVVGGKVTKASKTRTQTTAKVTRVDADGSVTIDAGFGDTPAAGTSVAVKEGDTVAVTIENDAATITGNYSAPSTDDTKAEEANETATRALTASETAAQAAASAVASAATASSAAASAQTSAGNAQASANEAAAAAGRANYALSDLERVVGTVNWIAEHGTYELTSDTAIVSGKTYYTRSGTSPNYTYTVVADPVASGLPDYYELDLDESVQQYIAAHLWLDTYGLNLSVDSASGWRIHQGTVDGTLAVGTYIIDPNGAVVMTMNAGGAQIGKSDESHLELDYHSMKMIDKDGETYFHVSDRRDEDGYVTDMFEGDGSTRFFYFSATAANESDITVAVDGSIASGVITTTSVELAAAPASGSSISVRYPPITEQETELKGYTFGTRTAPNPIGRLSVAEGLEVTASGEYSHAEGSGTIASSSCSHSEGSGTCAAGINSHSEGCETLASGNYSHAQGLNTRASGLFSHAEGRDTLARGDGSHAEGRGAVAWGAYSHAGGYETEAGSSHQTVIGKHNAIDYNNLYPFIIGNGASDSARSNAFAVDWDGNVEAAGTFNIANSIQVVQVSLTSSGSVSAGGESGVKTTDISADIPSGYTPIFVTMRGTGNHRFYLWYLNLDSATQVSYRVHNASSSAATAAPTAYVVCVKS